MGTKTNIRTTSAKHDWDYDNLIADLDVSSLRYLSKKYHKDLDDFMGHNDLNDQTNAQIYKDMMTRKKMIDEEIYNRKQWNNVLDYELDDDG